MKEQNLKNSYIKQSFILFSFVFLVLASVQSISARHLSVNLRSSSGGFMVAENGGGGIVNANRNQAREWETFTILDLNDGELMNGDKVNLRTVNGFFIVAIDGGGGELLADRRVPLDWETFKIIKLNSTGGNFILEGDTIAFKSVNGHFITATDFNSKVSAVQTNTVTAARFSVRGLSAPAAMKLSGPFTLPQAIVPIPMGVDESGGSRPDPYCTNSYLGNNMPNCYSGHTGTDFGFFGHFAGMNLGSIEVVAAAPGRVVAIDDGNFDRCHFRFPPPPSNSSAQDRIVCPNVPDNRQDANFVVILQDDGLIAYYYHLKNGSVAVSVGQRVECGQLLGKVGSSGTSSAPHLHFELRRIEPCSTIGAVCFPSFSTDFNTRQGTVINPYSPMLWIRLVANIPQKVCGDSSTPSNNSGDLGQTCGNFNACRIGLTCQSGTCKRIAVPPGGACDQNQLCGPGLQCGDGKCKLQTPNIRRPDVPR